MHIHYKKLLMMLLPWVTVFFIPKKSFYQFLPVTLFSTIFLLIEGLFSIEYRWWKVKSGIPGMIHNALSFILGPYFIGNILIFHFTYKKFWLYALINLIMDLLIAYPLNYFFQKQGFYKLKNAKPSFLFITSYIYSLINYGFQKLLEKNIYREQKHSPHLPK